MRRFTGVIVLVMAALISLSLARQAVSREGGPDGPLIGKWKITHRPVDAAGTPCPFLPETIEFFPDHTLIMSNVPGAHLPYKTDLTADEAQALIKRSEGFRGKSLLLVKPSPQMDWRSTPMVYIYSVTKDGLTLTAQGWEPATFKRAR